jgi:hypothetical protein
MLNNDNITDGLQHIHPFGLNTFFKRLGSSTQVLSRFFFGKKAADFTLPSDQSVTISAD